MSLLINSGVVSLIREFALIAPDARNELQTSPSPYYPLKGAWLVKKRSHITLSSTFNGFNPPAKMVLPKEILRGWRLSAEPFFLTEDARLLVCWKSPKYFATEVSDSTAETISIFFTPEHLKFALDELIDIVHS